MSIVKYLKALGVAFCPLSEYCVDNAKSLRLWKMGQYIGLSLGGAFSIAARKAHDVVQTSLEKNDRGIILDVQDEYFELKLYENLVIGASIFAILSFAMALVSTSFAWQAACKNRQFVSPQQFMLREFPLDRT